MLVGLNSVGNVKLNPDGTEFLVPCGGMWGKSGGPEEDGIGKLTELPIGVGV